MVGFIGLGRWNTITYAVQPIHWNHGYCTEALLSFLDNLWKTEPKRGFVDASVMEGNDASKRVLEKCGFKRFDGRSRRRFVKKEKDIDEEEGNDEDLLTEDTINALKSAIAGMEIQYKSTVEPIRESIGGEIMSKRMSLIGFRRYREPT
ncbi:acyl-CoA N-acyltransferase [Venturia nashicola]|nr:acyl-CoA N-acyltransferase [Venturia nashicola]